MNHQLKIATCLAAAMATSACSTKPRQFSASVTPIDTMSLANGSEAADFSTCDRLVRSGHRSSFAAAAATGAAGGAAALGGAVAVGTTGLVGGSMSAAGAAAAAAMPIIGFAAAFGVNRMIRSGKERKYKRVMADCMQEFGYAVVDWSRTHKKEPGTAIALTRPVSVPMKQPVSPAVAAPEPTIAAGSE